VTVDGAAVADRLRGRLPLGSPAGPLVDQLYAGMGDAEYAALAVAIVRILARREG